MPETEDGKKLYPPNYLAPGMTTRLTAQDGVIEFIGTLGEGLTNFLVAFAKWKQITEAPMQPSQASIESAAREMHRAWDKIDTAVMIIVMGKLEEGGIWIPPGGGSHA